MLNDWMHPDKPSPCLQLTALADKLAEEQIPLLLGRCDQGSHSSTCWDLEKWVNT